MVRPGRPLGGGDSQCDCDRFRRNSSSPGALRLPHASVECGFVVAFSPAVGRLLLLTTPVVGQGLHPSHPLARRGVAAACLCRSS